MSYNVAICTPPVPLADEAAWAALDTFIDAKGPVPQVFRALHDRLIARYPCICSLPDETVDEEVSGVTVRSGIILVIAPQYWDGVFSYGRGPSVSCGFCE